MRKLSKLTYLKRDIFCQYSFLTLLHWSAGRFHRENAMGIYQFSENKNVLTQFYIDIKVCKSGISYNYMNTPFKQFPSWHDFCIFGGDSGLELSRPCRINGRSTYVLYLPKVLVLPCNMYNVNGYVTESQGLQIK